MCLEVRAYHIKSTLPYKDQIKLLDKITHKDGHYCLLMFFKYGTIIAFFKIILGFSWCIFKIQLNRDRKRGGLKLKQSKTVVRTQVY